MIGEIKICEFINSEVLKVSFELFRDDWNLMQQSDTWKRIENFLAVSGITGETMSQVQKVNLLEAGSLRMAKRKSVREILHQQLELLAEESKHALPANCELSKNSFAMVKISNELLKRKCLSFMFAFTLIYFIKCFTIHGK